MAETTRNEAQRLSRYDTILLEVFQTHYREYVGVDKMGALYVLPVEAKSQAESEMIGRVQVAQMARLIRQDFPALQRRIPAVKALEDGTIGAVEFDDRDDPDDFGIVSISRFRLIRREEERSDDVG